jgi:hypothetical protein
MMATSRRVIGSTSEAVTERIRERTDRSVALCAAQGPEAIERRLAELDREWDIERAVETVAPTLSLVGLLLGVRVNRRWLLLPAVVQTFLLQHAIQGWCPPIPVLRRLGVRTAEEIGEERYALKALRGDFRPVAEPRLGGSAENAADAMQAVRR